MTSADYVDALEAHEERLLLTMDGLLTEMECTDVGEKPDMEFNAVRAALRVAGFYSTVACFGFDFWVNT